MNEFWSLPEWLRALIGGTLGILIFAGIVCIFAMVTCGCAETAAKLSLGML